MPHTSRSENTLLARLYAIQSQDDDIVRRGQYFIALCLAYILFTSMCLFILPNSPHETVIPNSI